MKQYKLDNNFSVCLVPIDKAKIVSMRLVIRSGMAYETKETLGYSHMLEHILIDSNPKYPGTKGIEVLESKGIDMNASTGTELVDYRFTGDANEWKTIFEFLYYSVVSPKFTKQVFNREKKAIFEELKNHLDDKLRPHKDNIMKTLYANNVLRYTVADTIESTKKCTLGKIKKFFYQQYAPQNITLLVVGKFPMKQLQTKINLFADFEKHDSFRCNDGCPNIVRVNPPKEIYTKCPKANKVYCDMIFKLDIEPFSEDYYCGKVFEYIATNGFLSVFYKKLRLEKNWIYHMDSVLDVTCYDSDFTITFNTDSKNFGIVIEKFLNH